MLKIKYLGHSGFILDDGKSKVVIDPYLTGNPLAKSKPEEIKANYILITHGHGDHLGDSVPIAKNCNATIIAPFELAMFCSKKGANIHPMHIGGSFNFEFGKVKLTIAHHGSSVDEVGETGNPCGYLITMGGKTVYHAGDTGLFMDMKLIGENKIDLALLPIGGNFTMDLDDAVKAVQFIKPKMVVPMHYGTFDVIKKDPKEFAKKLKGFKTKVKIMEIGDEIEIK
jgi:L-ascorbate metabolism protein UlaG (beta-lactamase superfamily)